MIEFTTEILPPANIYNGAEIEVPIVKFLLLSLYLHVSIFTTSVFVFIYFNGVWE